MYASLMGFMGFLAKSLIELQIFLNTYIDCFTNAVINALGKANPRWQLNTLYQHSAQYFAIIMNINDCFLIHNILIMTLQSKCSPPKQPLIITTYHSSNTVNHCKNKAIRYALQTLICEHISAKTN